MRRRKESPIQNQTPTSLLDAFDSETARKIALEEIQKTIGYRIYDPNKNKSLIENISKGVIQRLAPDGESNFKYITHCMISPKDNLGVDQFSNNLWNCDTDGIAVVHFENSNLRFCMSIWGIKRC